MKQIRTSLLAAILIFAAEAQGGTQHNSRGPGLP